MNSVHSMSAVPDTATDALFVAFHMLTVKITSAHDIAKTWKVTLSFPGRRFARCLPSAAVHQMEVTMPWSFDCVTFQCYKEKRWLGMYRRPETRAKANVCAERVPVAPAVGAMLPCLCLVPWWHRVRCPGLN